MSSIAKVQSVETHSVLALVHRLFEISEDSDLPNGDQVIAAKMLVDLLQASQTVKQPILPSGAPK